MNRTDVVGGSDPLGVCSAEWMPHLMSRGPKIDDKYTDHSATLPAFPPIYDRRTNGIEPGGVLDLRYV